MPCDAIQLGYAHLCFGGHLNSIIGGTSAGSTNSTLSLSWLLIGPLAVGVALDIWVDSRCVGACLKRWSVLATLVGGAAIVCL
jgi:hypothetical protein